MKRFYFIFKWVSGFFALLAFDLFVEGFVFEWLEWNGTTKNDWFFHPLVGSSFSVVFWIIGLYLSLYESKLSNE